MAIPKIEEICDCCGGQGSQPILQLFDDKCFKIVEQDKTSGDFCLDDFAFPVDGSNCTNFNVGVGGGEHLLFDNDVTIGSPGEVLEADKLYARGILLKIVYPINDDNGEEIPFVDKSVTLMIEDVQTLEYKSYPLHNFFAIFTNPKSNDPADLINRIKVVNPNDNFQVRITGTVYYGKAIAEE